MKYVELQLRNAGYRRTKPREVVLRVLQSAADHIKPEDILKKGRALYPALGRATVYRTLELLTRMGVVRPIYISDDGPWYTLTAGGHHHLVCTGCGDVIEIEGCKACDPTKAVAKRSGFRVESHLLEFYGRCRRCQNPDGLSGRRRKQPRNPRKKGRSHVGSR